MVRSSRRRKQRTPQPAPSPPHSRRLKASIKPRIAVTILAIGAVVVTALVIRNGSVDTPEQSSLPALEVASSAAYVDPATCRSCHQEIWQTFRKTGMARSFRRLRPGIDDEISGPAGPFYHEASDRYYAHVERDGRYFQRRYQKDVRGRETNVLEKAVHFVMGSGNHARTFLHGSPSGKLVQLPLGWYSEGGGRWAMSPGYDRPNHDGFQRLISFDCMFCHNGLPEIEEGKDHPGMRPLFRGAIPEGIDC